MKSRIIEKSGIRKTGFIGGCDAYELGPVKDMVLFFDCIDYFVVNFAVKHHPKQDWCLLTDRLYRRYRRYLRLEELDVARELMQQVKEIFSKLASDEVDWRWEMQGDINQTWLDARQPTLDIIFSKYFEKFNEAVDSAIHFNKKYGEYFPPRISITNSIIFVLERDRPLEQYDALAATDEPFWWLPEEDFNKSLEGIG